MQITVNGQPPTDCGECDKTHYLTPCDGCHKGFCADADERRIYECDGCHESLCGDCGGNITDCWTNSWRDSKYTCPLGEGLFCDGCAQWRSCAWDSHYFCADCMGTCTCRCTCTVLARLDHLIH